MTLGQKLKEMRTRLGLSQEQFAKTINVSRQAIIKWESDKGIPDISNLQELSEIFGVTIDYLLNDEKNLPALSMKIKLEKEKYENKLSMYSKVLEEYYSEPYKIYTLTRTKKLNFIELIIDTFIAPEIGPVSTADELGNLSPYYLVKKDNLKLLVNIKNYTLEVIELPSNTNEKKFTYKNNKFINSGKLKLNNDKK